MSDRHRPHPRGRGAKPQTACPTEDELLRLLDGELAQSRADAVRDHVHACWSCRARYEDLKATISAFVEAIEGPVRASIPAPPRQWAGFQAKLRAAAAAAAERRARAAPSLPARVVRAASAIARAASPIACAGYARARSAAANVLAQASMRHVLTSTALAALVALFIAFVPASPRLSAQVIIDQAMAADSRRVAQVARPVTRQRFEASRRVNGRIVDRAQWELYHDVQSGRARVYAIASPVRASSPTAPGAAAASEAAASGAAASGGAASGAGVASDAVASGVAIAAGAAGAPGGTLPPLAAEVVRLLDAHDWNGGGPLSSASYNRWQRSIAPATTDYTTLTLDDGRAAYRVRARMPEPVVAGAIASAGLVVRAEDWHAVRQELEVRTATGTDDIQITELAFDVLRFDRLAAGIFTDETPALAKAPAAAPHPPSVADLDAAEMSVRYALHRLQADRGEPIQIVRGPQRVTVRGLVDSTARATELEASLGRINGVRVDLTALDRLDAGTIAAARRGGRSSRSRGATTLGASPLSSSALGPDSVPDSGSDSRRGGTVLYADRSVEPPLQPVIDAFLAVEGIGSGSGERASLATRRNAFVARTLAASDRAMADAWALRRLADRYPQGAIADMSERSSELLEEMVRDHVRELIVSTSAWRAELSALAPFARARLTGTSTAGGGGGVTANADASPTLQSALPSGFAREPWPAYGATMFRVFVRAQSSTTDGLVGAEALEAHAAERSLLSLLDDLTALEQMLRRLDDEARQGHRLTGASAAPAAASPR